MSPGNVELIQRVFDHWNATGELPWDAYDSKATFTMRGELAGRETVTGRADVERALASFSDAWERITAEVVEVVDLGDAAVAVIRFHNRSRSGIEIEAEEGWAYWMRDGKIRRVEQWGTKQEALDAVRLRE